MKIFLTFKIIKGGVGVGVGECGVEEAVRVRVPQHHPLTSKHTAVPEPSATSKIE